MTRHDDDLELAGSYRRRVALLRTAAYAAPGTVIDVVTGLSVEDRPLRLATPPALVIENDLVIARTK